MKGPPWDFWTDCSAATATGSVATRRSTRQRTSTPQDTPASRPVRAGPATGDEAAIERYRYLLRTAPPEAIEQAHAEAFATLTPEQRRTVLTELGSQVPASERAASDDPKALARMATRAEMRQPGLLERTFSARGTGMGAHGHGWACSPADSSRSMAGAFVGTAIAEEIFNDDHDNDAGDNNDDSNNDDSNNDNGNDGNDSGNDGSGDNSGGDQSDAQTVSDSGDYGSGGYDGGDYGNDGYGGGDGSGDAFGGFGGGDYGGGDVGGGDLGGGFDA